MTLKDELVHQLLFERNGLRAKIDGLDEYDVRRPLVSSGTNLLGLLKHTASVELGYVTEVFGREPGLDLPWLADDAEPEADMWARPEESRELIVEVFEHAGREIEASAAVLELDSPGRVPWWRPETADVTFGRILVHLVAEVSRHAGHADIVRELIDDSRGLRVGDPNVPTRAVEEWAAHRQRIEDAAASFRG